MYFEDSDPGDDGIAIVTNELRAESDIRRLVREAPHQALRRAESLRDSIDSQARPRAHLYATILDAVCATAAALSDTAEPLLSEVLARCAAAGTVQPLLDEGPEFVDRIKTVAAETVRGRGIQGESALAFLTGCSLPTEARCRTPAPPSRGSWQMNPTIGRPFVFLRWGPQRSGRSHQRACRNCLFATA